MQAHHSPTRLHDGAEHCVQLEPWQWLAVSAFYSRESSVALQEAQRWRIKSAHDQPPKHAPS